jgi:hypothetical protein
MLLLCIVRDFPENARVLDYSVVKVPEDSGFYVTAKVESRITNYASRYLSRSYNGLLGLVSKIETTPTCEWDQSAERQTIRQNVVGKQVA